jgi:hypothetical protein
LGFRQVVGAFLLDGILGRQHEERLGQRVGFAAVRDAALLHRLQQRGLRFGRRPVDFVREQHVGEDRPLHEREFLEAALGILLDDLRADNVGRQQVRRELDP